ncbi:MAG: S8 family serine peptidase, partial [Acidimicrobiia bacterium]|nr:S8 family serine peptidase [Acidimicrobiia bacterium]
MFRRLRIVSLTALLVLAQLVASPAAAFAADSKAGADTAIGTTGRYIVEFSARADLRPARSIDDFTARGQFVVDALRSTATTSQREALALARSLGVPSTSYWLRNVMVVEATETQIARISALRSVASVHLEKIYPLVEPIPADEAIAVAVGDPEWGVAKIGADQVWAEGILGSGVVVANVDTGVDYLHPALVAQYRGNNGDGTFDHNYNWWDPSGICGAVPCDNAGHGTHTMGTMVGGDGPGPFTPDIGVAPGAEWIAAKGCEDFGCSEGSLLSSGQFILAPTDSNGLNPDPSMRPDIVNNSWGGGPGDTFYLEIVQAWRAAGIIPVFSSGNPGPFCGEGGSPGDFTESFSVGATDINDVIADFSGRGPSAFGKNNPDVSAPGVDVNSSLPGGGYGVFSGTSMAAPHVAGTFALMLSAASDLIGDVDSATQSMAATAMDIIDMSCGGDADGDPNNVYGDGRIDAQAAVALVATGGTLVGTVKDSQTGDPVSPAKVIADNGVRTFSASGALDGTYKLFLPAGSYDVEGSGFGYEVATANAVEIVTDETTTQDFSLVPLPRATLSGTVMTAEAGIPVPGAKVEALGVPVAPATADASGAYTLILPIGTYTIEASNGGCILSSTDSVTLDQDTNYDFELVSKIDQFGHGCVASPQGWVDVSGKMNLRGDDQFRKVGLPFDFPFYGESYRTLYVTTNGYMSFTRPDFAQFFGDQIPSSNTPNNAIYPLWTDLVVDDASQVEWGIYRPDRRGAGAFVLEFTQLRVFGGTATVDLEVFLWKDGRIDMLYRNNTGNPGDGGSSTIGIENATGSDAFQFSFQERSLAENVGYRYLVVPTGFAAGVVTNGNDGLPVAGATVISHPSGTAVTTGADGSYSIRLVPGDHSLDVAAKHHVGQSVEIAVEADATTHNDFVLAAAAATLSTDAISTVTDPEVVTTATFDITNDGTVTLDWSLKERNRGATPPDLPDAPAIINGYTRTPEWGPAPWKPLAPTASVQFDGPFESLVSDPMGDAIGPVDVIAINGGADEAELGLELVFTGGTPMDQTVGYVLLDTDQNAATGRSALEFSGLETQDVGVEYFVDLFAASQGVAYVVDAVNFNLVAVVDVTTVGSTMTFAIPVDAIGGSRPVNLATVLGDFFQPTDWAPDEGHGSILPFSDAPWMSADVAAGSLEPGESATVTVTLGGAGFSSADYVGDLAVVANDPRKPVQLIDV